MQTRTRSLAIACVASAAIALPAAATAATKVVYSGPPPFTKQLLKKLPPGDVKALKAHAPALDVFRLSTVTIHAGDSVQWLGLAQGFHNVDLPGASGKDLPLFVTDPTHRVSGVKDAAGNPFWFNGLPSLGFNPKLFAPLGTHTYDGSKRIASAVPFGPTKPFKVTFTKPGRYVYFCDVHPGMKAYVVVRAKGKRVPSASEDAKALKKEVKSDIASAVALLKRPIPRHTVDLGQSDGNGVELLAMFPRTLHVHAGTVVTFSMVTGSREVHTATFGPRALLTSLSSSFGTGPTLDPRSAYPSDNPAHGSIKLRPSSHGNGFGNTGLLDADPTTPYPASGRIKFTKAGTFTFICLVHANMIGTIVVK